MRRNASYTAVGKRQDLSESKVSEQPYHRFIYINEQNNRRENATIFHSPFKNGKRNPDYSNPTFMSSDILYPRQYVEEAKKTPKKAVIPSKNEERLRHMKQERSIGKFMTEINIEQLDDNVSLSKSRMQPRPLQLIVNNRMRRELEAVKKQRNELNPRELSGSMLKGKGDTRSKTPTKNEDPVYLQNKVEVDRLRNETKEMLQRYLQQALSQKQKSKEAENRNKQTDKKLMDAEEKRFRQQLTTSKQFERERAQLLKELLVSQVGTRK